MFYQRAFLQTTLQLLIFLLITYWAFSAFDVGRVLFWGILLSILFLTAVKSPKRWTSPRRRVSRTSPRRRVSRTSSAKLPTTELTPKTFRIPTRPVGSDVVEGPLSEGSSAGIYRIDFSDSCEIQRTAFKKAFKKFKAIDCSKLSFGEVCDVVLEMCQMLRNISKAKGRNLHWNLGLFDFTEEQLRSRDPRLQREGPFGLEMFINELGYAESLVDEFYNDCVEYGGLTGQVRSSYKIDYSGSCERQQKDLAKLNNKYEFMDLSRLGYSQLCDVALEKLRLLKSIEKSVGRKIQWRYGNHPWLTEKNLREKDPEHPFLTRLLLETFIQHNNPSMDLFRDCLKNSGRGDELKDW